MACASSTQNDNTAYLDHFTCNICLEVPQEPVQCVKNEHYFCMKCITIHLTRSQTCPVCQDALTPETLRPIPRTVANLLEQFQPLTCKYASRGCTTAIKREDLFSHQEECGFAPVQCSHEGCEATVDRQDLVSHQQACEFRSVTCEDCQEAMKQREYGKHGCVFRREIDENRRGLVEIQKILREMQDEQLRQSAEIQRLASRESGQPHAAQIQDSENLRQPTSELRQPNPTQGQGKSVSEAPANYPDLCTTISSISLSPTRSQTTVNKQIVVAGGRSKSYEVFNWDTQEWSLQQDSLFFEHYKGFSFVYDNKMMLCGGTSTIKVECVDIANKSVSTFPALLPGTDCGKGVLSGGDKMLTFGQSVSATSLKPPFKTTVVASYTKSKVKKSSCYGVACVNENAVVIVGGCRTKGAEQSCDNVSLYNPATKCFESLSPLPYSVADMAVVVYKDNIVILGGRKAYYHKPLFETVLRTEYLNDALMYNISKQQCRKLPSMLEKRSGCAAVIMGDTIIAMGGCNHLDLKTAEYLVLGEDTWKKLPPMHYARAGATACLLP